jgi:hypothetical protein
MKEKVDIKKYFENNKNSILRVFGIFLIVVFILYLATSVLPKTLVTLSKASFSDKVVVSNSYLIGQKILAKADGKDDCVVSVYLLDKDSKAVRGKSVELVGVENIKSSGVSDNDGKITFKLTSTEEKQYRINANYSGQQLPQTIVVTFRN